MAHLLQMELVRLSCCLQSHRHHHASALYLHGHNNPAHHHSSSSPIFCLSSDTQPDPQPRIKPYTRTTKQDAQLRKDLQLFLSSQGRRLDEVPSMKELSDRGREDLAKRVRRRGYKAIEALLADSDLEPGSAILSNEVFEVEDSVMGASETTPVTASPVDEQLLITSGTPTDTSQVVGKDSNTLRESIESQAPLEATMLLNESLAEKQAEEKLHVKAAEFVRTGRLDQVTDSDEEEDEDNNAEFLEDSSDEEENVDLMDGQITSEDIAVEKAAKLRAKLLPFLNNASGQPHNQAAKLIFDSLQTLKTSDDDQASIQIGSNSTSDTDLELQKMKSALICKEKELSEVSRDLLETKAQLALVQAKATAEVAQAKQLALEKDIRLKSADLALANLKQVQVEYWGEGGRIELAGSFNGWKYFIPLEPDPTSEIIKPDGSRGPMMWGTELWLYPGVYEIKFIVDGNWQIDQRREIVMRNSLHNNLLRVEA